jgi:hypothetical protein
VNQGHVRGYAGRIFSLVLMVYADKLNVVSGTQDPIQGYMFHAARFNGLYQGTRLRVP